MHVLTQSAAHLDAAGNPVAALNPQMAAVWLELSRSHALHAFLACYRGSTPYSAFVQRSEYPGRTASGVSFRSTYLDRPLLNELFLALKYRAGNGPLDS